jgi:2-C-methyl-D-erythritol 2,4-cyclodiphosphate synthase
MVDNRMRNRSFRIGNGFDFHTFQSGRKLILGGVEIPSTFGLLGHSDADALIHAICDSLLGAIGETDIGTAFPDDEEKNKNISSLIILQYVADRLKNAGYQIENLDTVIIAEVPKINPHIQSMKEKIAEVLEISETQIGIKATTMEKKGPIGRKEGLAVQAIALISPAPKTPD